MTPLRRRMKEDMAVRNLSPRTQSTYVLQVSLFARHFETSPHLLGPEQIRDYQVFLATEKQLAPGSIGVAVSALRFLYGVTLGKAWDIPEILPAPKQPSKLPVVPSPEEVALFLDSVASVKHHAILTACYAAGLRISEAVSLRPADIDSQRMLLRVEQGKGGKDRYLMLSPKLLEVLRDYWRRTRPAGEWLFPGLIPGNHVNRHTVEKACQKAREAAGLAKRLTPHSLRHGFAAHMLENGADVRTIQLLLGHRSLATTARYMRVTRSAIRAATSPFDRLPVLPAADDGRQDRR